jgi:hypothetical protein
MPGLGRRVPVEDRGRFRRRPGVGLLTRPIRAALQLRWSRWRRRHQATARASLPSPSSPTTSSERVIAVQGRGGGRYRERARPRDRRMRARPAPSPGNPSSPRSNGDDTRHHRRIPYVSTRPLPAHGCCVGTTEFFVEYRFTFQPNPLNRRSTHDRGRGDGQEHHLMPARPRVRRRRTSRRAFQGGRPYARYGLRLLTPSSSSSEPLRRCVPPSCVDPANRAASRPGSAFGLAPMCRPSGSSVVTKSKSAASLSRRSACSTRSGRSSHSAGTGSSLNGARCIGTPIEPGRPPALGCG